VGDGLIILKKNPVQRVGEGNGERGGYVGAQKEINAGVQDKVRSVSYSWLAANKTFHIKHALKQRHIVFFRSNRKK
jgi:hypothetical protein